MFIILVLHIGTFGTCLFCHSMWRTY